MACLLLAREEDVTDIKRLQLLKEFYGRSTVRFNGITYTVRDEDSSLVEVISKTGKSSVKKIVSGCGHYPRNGMISNGIVWKGEAFFFSDGFMWALNLDRLSWRYISQVLRRGNILLETSNADDLLQAAEDGDGTIIFTRFRPSFSNCQFVINYSLCICISGEIPLNVSIRIGRNPKNPGSIIAIPPHIVDVMREDGRLNSEKGNRLPLEILKKIRAIGDGRIPYPRSAADIAEIWRPTSKEEEVEKIQELRKRDSDSDSSLFSRQCPICYVANPSQRAVYIECGHLSCLACAKQLTLEDKETFCPLCERKTTVVRIYEQEDEDSEFVRSEDEEKKLQEKKEFNLGPTVRAEKHTLKLLIRKLLYPLCPQ